MRSHFIVSVMLAVAPITQAHPIESSHADLIPVGSTLRFIDDLNILPKQTSIVGYDVNIGKMIQVPHFRFVGMDAYYYFLWDVDGVNTEPLSWRCWVSVVPSDKDRKVLKDSRPMTVTRAGQTYSNDRSYFIFDTDSQAFPTVRCASVPQLYAGYVSTEDFYLSISDFRKSFSGILELDLASPAIVNP